MEKHNTKLRIINFVLTTVILVACQGTNTSTVTDNTPTPIPTVASILSPKEALIQMYGENVVLHGYSDQSDASIATGDITYNLRINMLNCYWEIESEKAVEKCMVITEKSQNYGGHPTGALIDGAIFDRTSTGGWKLRYLKFNMIELGSFGQIYQGSLIQIGHRNYAALLKGSYISGGENEQLVIIAETKESFGIIFQIVSSQSRNTGLKDVWAYNARLEFETGDYKQEYYNIVVRYYGTSEDGTTPPLKAYRYVDPQYVTGQ